MLERLRHSPKNRPAPIGPVGYLCLALAGLIATVPVAARADDPVMSLEAPVFGVEDVSLSLSVEGLLAEDVLEALEAGLPATLVLEWRLWRMRGRVWDETVSRGATLYRVRYDVLSDVFSVFDARGRPLHTASGPREAERCLSREMKIHLGPPGSLDPGRDYYAEARVRVEALAERDIAGLESWLKGGGAKTSRSLLSGLSRKAGGWFKGLVGPDSRSAWAKSEPFRVERGSRRPPLR